MAAGQENDKKDGSEERSIGNTNTAIPPSGKVPPKGMPDKGTQHPVFSWPRTHICILTSRPEKEKKQGSTSEEGTPNLSAGSTETPKSDAPITPNEAQEESGNIGVKGGK